MQGFGRTQQATNSVKLVIFVSKLIADNVFINEKINIYKKKVFPYRHFFIEFSNNKGTSYKLYIYLEFQNYNVC